MLKFIKLTTIQIYLSYYPMTKTQFMQIRGVLKCTMSAWCIIRTWKALSLRPRASKALMTHLIGKCAISTEPCVLLYVFQDIPHTEEGIAMNYALVGVAALELAIAIISSVICCRRVCCWLVSSYPMSVLLCKEIERIGCC